MIIVFGSINMDVSIRVRSFPAPGETVLSPDYMMSPGGKGANQALACARGGAKTALIGRIGDDAIGTKILNGLRRNEVMTSGVSVSEVLPTGLAVVMLDSSGENQIVVASGANADVRADQIPDEILKPGNIVLLQMELPLQENLTLMERAKTHGAMVLLNAAPALRFPHNMLEFVDYLIVNEHEARHVAEITVAPSADQDLTIVAKTLAEHVHLGCIITLGAKGAVAALKQGKFMRVPALPLAPDKIVDTTGAGDCFCGTLAAALHDKMPIEAALRRASVAAGLACTKPGAQESYPYLADIEEILENFPATEMAG
jgi:ribokinase